MIDFDQLITNHLTKESYPKKVGVYYPSAIGTCMRKYWYSYKYPQDIRPETQKVFHMGNVLHDFVVEVLKSERNPDVELLQSELPVKTEHGGFLISGRIDDVIVIKSKGKTILVEVKSLKDIKWQQKPSRHHVIQLQFYMYASGIHNGILLYIDRDGLKTKTFEIKYDEGLAKTILQRFAKFHRHITENNIPEPEAKQHSDEKWMCKYCEYADRCGKE
jgi:CRISPR/Cas system-associated exonuclease Cas4 (RecB family)